MTAERILRSRHGDLYDAFDRQRRPDAEPMSRMAAQIYDGGHMGASGDLYYLAHPVSFTGTETEGAADAGTADTTTSMTVFVLGAAPNVGDIVNAFAVGNRWVARIRSGGGALFYACGPCEIPATDLTVSYTNILTGNGSTALVYAKAGPTWTSACVDGLQFQLRCNGAIAEFLVLYWITGGCPGPGLTQYCSNIRGAPLGLTLVSQTCGPGFNMVLNVTNEGCPVVGGSGYTSFTVTP